MVNIINLDKGGVYMPLMIKEFDGANPEFIKENKEKEMKDMTEAKRMLSKKKGGCKGGRKSK